MIYLSRKNEKHGKHKRNYQKIEKTKSTKTNKKAIKPQKESKEEKQTKTKTSAPGYKNILILTGVFMGLIAVIFAFSLLTENSGKDIPKETKEGKLVVTVNGEPIYSDEIEKRTLTYQAQYGPSFTEDMVIEQTVKEKLLLQEAQNKGLSASQGQIDSAVNQWLTNLRQSISDEELKNLLSQENLTMEEYVQDLRDSVRTRIMITKLLNETLISGLEEEEETIDITEQDIIEEYEKNKEKYQQVKVSHILVCHKSAPNCPQNRTKEEAKELIEQIRQKLIEGENFETLAQEYSDCPSYTQGGELDWFVKEGQMVKNFSKAAFELNKNQFSEPVPTEFGYHLIKMIDKKTTLEELKQQIQMQLQLQKQMENNQLQQTKEEQAISDYIDNLWAKSEIIYHREDLKNGIEEDSDPSEILTFSKENTEMCTENGKPVIYLFSSSTCPHSSWIAGTFNEVANEYIEKEKIKAYHWQLDTKNNILTEEIEGEIPTNHMSIFQRYSPQEIPAFVFGCKYYRIGNGYQEYRDLEKEKEEFIAVIEDILKAQA